jgi:large subunit ribosomal protein L24
MHIKKGDNVQILSGKNRGKTGAVISVFPDADRISVEGVNMYKKRARPKRQGEKGETVLVVRPLAASNAALVCGNCKKPTRVGFRYDGTIKVRYCKKCEAAT